MLLMLQLTFYSPRLLCSIMTADTVPLLRVGFNTRYPCLYHMCIHFQICRHRLSKLVYRNI